MTKKRNLPSHIALINIQPQQLAKFNARVNRSGGTEACWPWTRSLDTSGYGKFKLAKWTVVRAHRVAYFAAHGVDPGEKLVCHRCDNRQCCNPAHLFVGDHRDNMRDAASKGRLPGQSLRGTRNPSAKLTAEQTLWIKQAIADGQGNAEIASGLPVTPAMVSRIRNGLAWSNSR